MRVLFLKSMTFLRFPLIAALAIHTASADTSCTRETVLALAAREDLTKSRDQLVKFALKEAEKPIITRPGTLAELLEKYPESMKYQTKPAHQEKLSEEEWERFALSLSDANLNGTLSERLPRIAAAYVFSKDEKLAVFLRAQLDEIANWKPLERPGTSSTKKNLAYAPWLGTGWAIRAITDTLDILPEGTLPEELRNTLKANLETEISGIRQAFREKKLWNTRESSAYSNQWVVPNEGLVQASIFNGLEKHREDYEAGITNLLKSLDAQGTHGEFAEGVSYAALTMNSLLSAAEAAANQGDRRLIDHPYLKKFPVWYAHHLQPGGRILNAFDSKVEDLDPALLSRFVSAVRSPEALWVIRRDGKDDFGSKLPGLVARSKADYEAKEPPLYGVYDFAARINWRDSWDDDTAAGFWMRGGHATDAHDHQDRGHVSFSIGKREVLIEAGITSYGIPEHPTHYRSVAGHNVLQIGNAAPAELTPAMLKKAGQILDPEHRSAPITVERIDATGGSASVDASGCYEGAERWVRHVTWDKAGVTVRDEVVLKSPDYVTFRWHLAAAPDAPETATESQISIGGIQVGYDADAPVTAIVEAMPGFDSELKEAKEHACVVIRSATPVKSLTLNSRIKPAP